MSDDHESRPTPILASDAERERSVAVLRDAVSEGRLTLEEFSERGTLYVRIRPPGPTLGESIKSTLKQSIQRTLNH